VTVCEGGGTPKIRVKIRKTTKRGEGMLVCTRDLPEEGKEDRKKSGRASGVIKSWEQKGRGARHTIRTNRLPTNFDYREKKERGEGRRGDFKRQDAGYPLV